MARFDSPDRGHVRWPSAFEAKYREAGHWEGIPLGRAFVEAARLHEGRIAVVDGERSLTYATLAEHVDRFARHLVARGIAGGERVLFQLPNAWEFVVAYFACLRVGAVPVCCLPHHRFSEMRALAELSGAKAWFVSADARAFDYVALAESVLAEVPTVKELWVCGGPVRGPATAAFDVLMAEEPQGVDLSEWEPAPDDVAVLQLSGGTTGISKLIPRTHDDYRYNSLAFARASAVDATSTLLLPIPIAHNFPLACPGLQGALLLGARVVLARSPAPEVVLPLVERERVTWMPAVPATLIRWTDFLATRRLDTSSLRQIYVGGQRLVPEAARAARAVFGPIVRQVYGMAEGLLCLTREEDPEHAHDLFQGRPLSPDDELRVVDDDGNDVAPGELGELLCRGPYTIRGYHRAAEHNAKAFTEDGFYRTGDMVRIVDGFVVVEGRKKDLINRGGEKISAEEIEDHLLSHPSVKNVAVVAVPDRVLGERACACVVLQTGSMLTLEEMAAFLRTKQIATFKIPERLETIDALPLTGVGKVAKNVLRAKLTDAS